MLTKNVSYTGQTNTSTFDGKIQLDEVRGRFVVSNQDGEEVTVQDVNGFHIFNDEQERTRLDTLGLTTIREDGTYATRVGQASSDNRDGMWNIKPGIDLRDKGI